MDVAKSAKSEEGWKCINGGSKDKWRGDNNGMLCTFKSAKKTSPHSSEVMWMEIGILNSELIAVATLTIFSRASPNLGGLLFVRSLPRARQPPTTEWKPDLVSQSHRH